MDDVFQSYYSSLAHHPALTVRWLASKRCGIELGGELWVEPTGDRRGHP